MTYSKQWKAIQDSYIGYQNWNQLQDNCEDFRTQFDVEHGTVETGQAANYYDFLGVHDSNEMAKGVGRVVVNTLSNGAVDFQWSLRGILYSAINVVERMGVGQYRFLSFVGANGTPGDGAAAEVTVETTAATPIRRAEVRFNDGSTNGFQFVGWEVLLLQWNSGGGTWDASDFTFNLVVYDP